ncbi:MAG TPA: bifunctional phosphopantothenoylcysteine decarboxylase/phosphopantothenate--cysteine ligase CoaBC [Solirubrobacteraceae bacterium]|nr:bifunctional phosphopantothenoylcysteine decarboxylase/phosphopantothenate--cysteine ligase CoaBC [Solirubrobacteraceae bacterium]
MARLLLGASGGIAAYKALELVRLATERGHAVRVIQTPASKRFVGSASFAALTGAAVLSSEFERDPLRGSFPGDPLPDHDPASHLALVGAADVYLVAPASANTIAKLAHGHADNLVATAALAATCPLLVAPAMNNRMYEHAATQRNLDLLRERGVTIVAPGSGRLATPGEHGVGRLAEPEQLLAACEAALAAGPWSGRRVLVTAGGTREAIDSVRFIGNRSSGRMGFAIADAAAARGAAVTVVAANVALPRNPRVRYLDVTSAGELAAACEREAREADLVVMCAAVADFRPAAAHDGKLARGEREHLTLELEATPDILAGLAATRRPGQTLVGFAAEHGAGGVERARAKLERKQVDLIAVNDVALEGIGFDADDNELTLLSAGGEQRIARAPKPAVARELLDAIEALAV